MGWLSDIGNAIGSAAYAVAGAVESTVNAVVEVVSDVVETVGNAIEDGLNAVADVVENIPLVGGFLGGVFRWAGSVVSGVFDVIGAAVKAIGSIVGGVLAGIIRVVGGILSLDLGLIGEGLLDIVSGIAGAVLILGGKIISVVQRTLLVEAQERALTKEEQEILRRVFRSSLALYNIRIVDGRAGLFGLNSRAFTLGNTIYLKGAYSHALLVHECTHAWQYQHLGSRYSSDAVGAQWFVEDEYSWEKEIARGNTEWVDFNKESQAAFVEDVFLAGNLNTGGVTTTGNGVFFDADGVTSIGEFTFSSVDRTALANRAVEEIRRISFRPSQFIP